MRGAADMFIQHVGPDATIAKRLPFSEQSASARHSCWPVQVLHLRCPSLFRSHQMATAMLTLCRGHASVATALVVLEVPEQMWLHRSRPDVCAGLVFARGAQLIGLCF